MQIIVEILRLCKSAQPKTCIMQKIGTSYSSLQTYLSPLDNSGLVKPEPETSKYVVTQKGRVFLEEWMRLLALLAPEDKNVFGKANKKIAGRKILGEKAVLYFDSNRIHILH